MRSTKRGNMVHGNARVVAVCTSVKKGMRKKPVPSVQLQQDHGIVGDAHAGPWHRQVSLLALESIRKMQAMGLDVDTGDFAENITTEGIEVKDLPIGATLAIGETILEITQIGKVCHNRCAIYYQAGDCVMPKEGVFAKVIRGGTIEPRNPIQILQLPQNPAAPSNPLSEEQSATTAGFSILTSQAPKSELA